MGNSIFKWEWWPPISIVEMTSLPILFLFFCSATIAYQVGMFYLIWKHFSAANYWVRCKDECISKYLCYFIFDVCEQVEGVANEDGRTSSIWDTFAVDSSWSLSLISSYFFMLLTCLYRNRFFSLYYVEYYCLKFLLYFNDSPHLKHLRISIRHFC